MQDQPRTSLSGSGQSPGTLPQKSMPQSYRQPLSWIALASLFALVLAGSGSSGAPANASLLPPGAVAPLERQKSVAKRIGMILEEAHYRHAQIDDRMSEQVFDRYLDSLDGQRSYFLASDVQELTPFRLRFDDMIHTGNVEPAYLIFARFQQRNRERIRYAMKLLEKEPDWTVSESFDFDRAKQPWAASAADLDELWRKRVKADGLSLVLAGKSWTEAADTLKKRYERVLKRVDDVRPEDVFENLMNSYARTYDPHSNYFGARNSEEYRIQMSLSYEGIGATLQSQDDYVQIVNLLPGGPAAVAGTLSINDRITSIAQGKDGAFQEVIGWRLDDVVQLIRGKNGTLVRLQVLPAGAAPGTPEKIIEFTRGKVTPGEPGRQEGKAARHAQRPQAEHRRHHRARASTGTCRRRARASRTTAAPRATSARLIDEFQKEGAHRRAHPRPARRRRRLSARSHRAHRPVHRQGPGGAAEGLHRPRRSARRPEPGHRVRRPARGAGGPRERLGVGDLRRRHPGLRPRLRRSASAASARARCRTSSRSIAGRSGPSKASSRSPSASSIASPASTQHRGVEPDIPLPSPISLEDVGERPRSGAAVGSHRGRPVPDAASADEPADRQHPDEGRRRSQPEGPELPLVRLRHLGLRDAAQAEDAVAEPGGAQGGTRSAREREPRSREPAPEPAGPAGAEVRTRSCRRRPRSVRTSCWTRRRRSWATSSRRRPPRPHPPSRASRAKARRASRRRRPRTTEGRCASAQQQAVQIPGVVAQHGRRGDIRRPAADDGIELRVLRGRQ